MTALPMTSNRNRRSRADRLQDGTIGTRRRSGEGREFVARCRSAPAPVGLFDRGSPFPGSAPGQRASSSPIRRYRTTSNRPNRYSCSRPCTSRCNRRMMRSCHLHSQNRSRSLAHSNYRRTIRPAACRPRHGTTRCVRAARNIRPSWPPKLLPPSGSVASS